MRCVSSFKGLQHTDDSQMAEQTVPAEISCFHAEQRQSTVYVRINHFACYLMGQFPVVLKIKFSC